ncbi:hypothetical protein KFD70_11140 [Bacillus pfraonensis]|uniref:hypothetical protein n=1 Tax=Bacillus TaxID=1386 RepID=UPI002A50F9DE|nr:hypothetical protein [Bacillus pseudomycoides]
MTIYYFCFEAIPCSDNPEKNDCTGAFINFWIGSSDTNVALTEANHYIENEGWKVINVKEQFIADRKQYETDYELKEELECFDRAKKDGIAAIFYTWSEE